MTARALKFLAGLEVMMLLAEPVSAALELDEIVVTAQKREEALQDVPLSVTALTASDLESGTITNVTEMSTRVPGLEFTTADHGGNSANFYIRGIGQPDFISTTEPGVGVYLDGVYVARTVGSSLDLLDVERVEILRGPQGTLFGKNTIGGAVNVVTRRPGFEQPEVIASVRLGERDRLNASLSGNVPLVDNVLAARFTITSKNQDGYGRSLFDGIKRSGEDKTAARASFLWDLNDAVDLLVSADWTRVRESSKHAVSTAIDPNTPFVTGPQNAFAEANGLIPFDQRYEVGDDLFVNDAGFDPGNDVDVWGVHAIATWDMAPDVQLRSITAYRDLRSFAGMDFDGSPIAIADQDVFDDQNQFSQEFLLSGDAMAGQLEWLSGLFYMHEEGYNEIMLRLSFEENPEGLDTRISNAFENDSYALFTQGTFWLSDRLSVIAGVRYSVDEKENTIRNFATKYGVDLVPLTTSYDDWSSWTWRAGLQYDVSEDVMLYGYYATGFKSGGFNGRAYTLQEFASFAPEEVATVEMGIKADLIDRQLRLSAAGYYSDYSNIQATVNITEPLTGQPLNVVQNAAAADIYGVEFEGEAILGDHVRTNVGITWMDNEYQELDPGVALTFNDKLPQTPEWTFLAGIEVFWPFATPMANDGEVTLRADYSWKDDFFHNFQNSIFCLEPSYDVLNLHASYGPPDGQWRVSAYALNALDQEYFLNQQDLLFFMAATGVPAAPREVGMEVTFVW